RPWPRSVVTDAAQSRGIPIEASGRLVCGIIGSVQVDYVGMEIEHLQPWPIEPQPAYLESGDAIREVEIVSVIGRDLDDVVMLPERPQVVDKGELIGAIIFDAEPPIDRQN